MRHLRIYPNWADDLKEVEPYPVCLRGIICKSCSGSTSSRSFLLPPQSRRWHLLRHAAVNRCRTVSPSAPNGEPRSVQSEGKMVSSLHMPARERAYAGSRAKIWTRSGVHMDARKGCIGNEKRRTHRSAPTRIVLKLFRLRSYFSSNPRMASAASGCDGRGA